jgi:uncharacterized protein (TIGR00290 family)
MSAAYAMMWSGGKDSALALHRARLAGLDVKLLITFYAEATQRVRFHATRLAAIEAQTDAIHGMELKAMGASWDAMETLFLDELAHLRLRGFTGVICGDIHLAEVRAWYEERVTASGLEHVEPIWGEPPTDLLKEFVGIGGRAVVTCVDLTRLDASWLGRIIDETFSNEICATGIDACGENGEYHSFAFQGPIFSRPVRWSAGQTRSDSRFVQLDVIQA